MLKVPPWKGVIHFGKRGKLNPKYIGPFKKCLSDESLMISLDEIQIDDKLHFVEELVEIIDRQFKRLKKGAFLLSRFDGTPEEVQSSRENVKTNFETSIYTSSPTPLRKETQPKFWDAILLT
nr:reverse transcriptase domain-containing protein [Tanacetum cinerariifolium]